MNHMVRPLQEDLVNAAGRNGVGVFLVSGSASRQSHTRCILDAAVELLGARGASCRIWDLALQPLLPAAHDDRSSRSQAMQTIESFCDAVGAADAVVLATPVYHGSYSGVLKTALDQLGKGAFGGKVIGLASHGSAPHFCGQPLEHLQTIATNLKGYPLPIRICTSDRDFDRAENGRLEIADRRIVDRIRRQIDDVVAFSKGLRLAGIERIVTP